MVLRLEEEIKEYSMKINIVKTKAVRTNHREIIKVKTREGKIELVGWKQVNRGVESRY